jgi:hypothetical protein
MCNHHVAGARVDLADMRTITVHSFGQRLESVGDSLAHVVRREMDELS